MAEPHDAERRLAELERRTHNATVLAACAVIIASAQPRRKPSLGDRLWRLL